MKRTKLTPELTQKIIYEYLSGLDTYQTAKKCTCSQTLVMNVLKRNNIPRRTTQDYTRKYITNNKFFENINNENNAYFLGLLYADGNNYVRIPHSYEISIKLQECDKSILEKLRDLLCPNMELKLKIDKNTSNKHYLFKINSKKISEQLSSLGCVPNKSLILTFPKFLDDNLLNHFIRGYFDGDGSLYCKPQKKSGQIDYNLQLTSSDKFCLSAKNKIENILNIHFSTKLAHTKTNQITTTLSVGGNNQVEKILDWIYKDATIYLPRKYDKYIEFKNYRNQTSSSNEGRKSSSDTSKSISALNKSSESLISKTPSSDILN